MSKFILFENNSQLLWKDGSFWASTLGKLVHVPDSLGTRLISSMAFWEISVLGRPMGRRLQCASTRGISADSHGAWLVLSFDTWEVGTWPGFPWDEACFEHRNFLSRIQLQFTSRFFDVHSTPLDGKKPSHTSLDHWIGCMMIVNDDLKKSFPTLSEFFLCEFHVVPSYDL